MNFIYEDLEITSLDLSEFSNTKTFSNIVFKNQTLHERLRTTLDDRFKFTSHSYQETDEDEQIIIWTSNIVSLVDQKHSIFLEKLLNSHGAYKWSNEEGFIYKGSQREFNEKKYTKLKLENHLFEINDFTSFQNLLETSLDTREFNEIQKLSETYVKKSKNKQKIENEFIFLNSLPKQLKPFYITVHSFNQTKDLASYSMPRIKYLDVSRRHINGEITEKEVKTFFSQLNIYFEKVMELGLKKTGNEYDFIHSKTNERISEYKKTINYNKVNNLFEFSQNSQNLDSTFKKLCDSLEKNKKKIIKQGSMLSHGDLCFSNILSSKDFRNLILIDPMGGTIQNSYKSIYYDFAKLSHSILGNYDLIIHGQADLKFNNDVELSIYFKKNKNAYLEENFLILLEKFQLDLKLTRLIEASLFLSMLPLHNESFYRTSMLALRGKEILDNINQNTLI